MAKHLFTSESVTEGHPDKLCDRISDAVLDAYLSKDPPSRVACETCVSADTVFITGEISSKASVDVESIVRNVIKETGYTDNSQSFSADNVEIILRLNTQSPDISQAVFKNS
jgi:S-adenosylmethionine synthetase